MLKASPPARFVPVLAIILLLRVPAGSAQKDQEIAQRAIAILESNCALCHGATQMSGLDLRQRDAILRGGQRGQAVIPGKAEESLLYLAASHQSELKMPPTGERLSDEQLQVLREWINQGVPWELVSVREQGHWAFRPLREVVPPADPTGWADHPIDHFVGAKLHQHGLTPVEPADQRTLIRRAYFDLIGLPPEPPEMEAFLADESPGAFLKLVDRLLAAPHYGERWGRHWMDVAHYADTAGDNADYPVPEARLYRDYIIDSFNADKPYDQFVREQIAGDILALKGSAEEYAERVIATGFLALSRRYATAPFELWHLTLEDTIETLGRSFLGLTLRCARCHDHKFDPVTMQDYYALYGIFASTQYPYAGSEEFKSVQHNRSGFVPLLPPGQAVPVVKAHQSRIEAVQKKIKDIEEKYPAAKELVELDKKIKGKSQSIEKRQARLERAYATLTEKAIIEDELVSLRAELVLLQQEREQTLGQLEEQDRSFPEKLKELKLELRSLQMSGLPPGVPGAYAVQEGQPADVHIHLGGDPKQEGPLVKRGALRFLTGEERLRVAEGSSGRLELAHWLTRPEHPLTARVMVNRIWQHHFGKGIVRTPSNFGLRGDVPSHPDLLDWLAGQFMESGWSIKAMHRLIMASKTYRLSSAHDDLNDKRDQSNQYYWRFERRRLEAEPIRDAMLSVSGNLDRTRPEEHPFPAIEDWEWTQHQPFKAAYPSQHRSVYLMTQRIQRHPYLGLFDCPDSNYSTAVRTSSTVPLQALYLMNNSFVRDQAKGLAERLIRTFEEPDERIEMAYQLAYGRPPSEVESGKARTYVQEYTDELKQMDVKPEHLEVEAWSSYAHILLTSNEFVYID